MKKAALYVRVSTEEQKKHGLSVDNQLDALKKYCDDNFIKDYKVYNDAGLSGHAAYQKRPALMQLISDCRAGEISVILFTRLDRWFRSVKDYYLVQDQIGSVPWKAIWEDYETETSSGQLKVNIMLSVAEAEASRTAEKIKSVFQYKRELGEAMNGKCAIGMRVVDKHYEKDPELAWYAEKMFQIYFDTLNCYNVFRWTQTTEYPCSYDVCRDRLTNPHYVGVFITQEQYDFIREQLKKHMWQSDPSKWRVYLFSGLIICPICGRYLKVKPTVRKLKDGTESAFLAYRCNRKCEPQIPERKIEDQLIKALTVGIGEKKVRAKKTSVKSAESANKKIDQKIERLKDLYIDGEISREEYDSRKAALEAQKQPLQASDDKEPPVLPPNWQEAYNGLDREHKRIFWHSVLKGIDISDRDNIKFFWQ